MSKAYRFLVFSIVLCFLTTSASIARTAYFISDSLAVRACSDDCTGDETLYTRLNNYGKSTGLFTLVPDNDATIWKAFYLGGNSGSRFTTWYVGAEEGDGCDAYGREDCTTNNPTDAVIIAMLGINDLTQIWDTSTYPDGINTLIAYAQGLVMKEINAGKVVVWITAYPFNIGTFGAIGDGSSFTACNESSAPTCTSVANANYDYFSARMLPWLRSVGVHIIDYRQHRLLVDPSDDYFIDNYGYDDGLGLHSDESGHLITYNYIVQYFPDILYSYGEKLGCGIGLYGGIEVH